MRHHFRRRSSSVPLLLVALLVLALATAAQAAGEATRGKVLAALPELGKIAQKIVDDDGTPGLSIAVVYQDEVVYLAGFGVKEAGRSDRVDADTVFQLASCSKPLAATVVAALVSDGTVSWDSKISDLDPSFELDRAYPTLELTVRDLFAHRSGLSGNAGNDLEGLGFDRGEILRRLRYLKATSSFRAGYAYSNFGITEGAVAAAKAAGKTWEDVAFEKLYKPLGMSATSSRYADFLQRANRAALHVRVDGKWAAKVTRDPDAQSPAGGVSSSARDLAQWMRLELGNGKFNGKQLIAEDAIGQTHLPVIYRGNHPVTGKPTFYGLGWVVDYGDHGVVWSHAGAFSRGAHTNVSLIPAEQLGIAVLSNAFPTGVPEGVVDDFFDLVFAGKPTRDWLAAWNQDFDSMFGPATVATAAAPYATPPAAPSPALPLSAYAGAYANDYLGNAVVSVENGALKMALGPATKSFPLKHFDRDLFTYAPYPETPGLTIAVTFAIGPDQTASQMTIDDLNDDGQGVLKRMR